MGYEVLLLAVPLPAGFTLDRLLSCVHPLVFQQTRRVGEHLLAGGAGIRAARLLPGVRPFVGLQVTLLREPLAARPAHERLVLGVRRVMTFQILYLSEPRPATVALKWLFTGVLPDVGD